VKLPIFLTVFKENRQPEKLLGR